MKKRLPRDINSRQLNLVFVFFFSSFFLLQKLNCTHDSSIIDGRPVSLQSKQKVSKGNRRENGIRVIRVRGNYKLVNVSGGALSMLRRVQFRFVFFLSLFYKTETSNEL